MTTWNVDKAHSAINFSVRHMVFAKVRGRFTKWDASVSLNDADLTKSSVNVEIDAASIDTGVSDRDNHLRSADFFDVEKYPTLSFKSGTVEKKDSERYVLNGELTIHGVTRPVSISLEYGGAAKDPWGKQRVAFTGHTSIDRKDFGLKWNQALEAGGVLVGEKVDIEVDFQAVAE